MRIGITKLGWNYNIRWFVTFRSPVSFTRREGYLLKEVYGEQKKLGKWKLWWSWD